MATHITFPVHTLWQAVHVYSSVMYMDVYVGT